VRGLLHGRWRGESRSYKATRTRGDRYGIGPIGETLIGTVEASAASRARALAKLAALGRRGD
jgi:hypothetical protein